MHCCSTHPHRAQHKCTGLHTRHTALLQSTQRQAFLCNDQHPLFCYNSDNKHTRKSIRSNKVNTMTSGAAGGAAAGTTPGQHDGQHDGELLDGYVAAFQEFAAIPTISKAQIQGVCDDAILMQVCCVVTQMNVDRCKDRCFIIRQKSTYSTLTYSCNPTPTIPTHITIIINLHTYLQIKGHHDTARPPQQHHASIHKTCHPLTHHPRQCHT